MFGFERVATFTRSGLVTPNFIINNLPPLYKRYKILFSESYTGGSTSGQGEIRFGTSGSVNPIYVNFIGLGPSGAGFVYDRVEQPPNSEEGVLTHSATVSNITFSSEIDITYMGDLGGTLGKRVFVSSRTAVRVGLADMDAYTTYGTIEMQGNNDYIDRIWYRSLSTTTETWNSFYYRFDLYGRR